MSLSLFYYRLHSVSLETPILAQTLGLGLARTGISDKAKTKSGTDMADSQQAGAFVRFETGDNGHITPSVQWIQNSSFDNSSSQYESKIMIYSLRSSYRF